MSEDIMSMKDRVELEGRSGGPVKNSMLTCKDCAFRIEDADDSRNTTRCEIFELKPVSVLLGKSCKEKVKQ